MAATPSRSSGDHPRLRGEHRHACAPLHVQPGSSPLARGEHLVGDALACGVGIIPACAGSTARAGHTHSACEDHPRLRGEHMDEIARAYLAAGSSPLARGARGHSEAERDDLGIIPACAGSTSSRSSSRSPTRDHPRLRGEHACMWPELSTLTGSSPLARGARTVLKPPASD